MPVGSHKDAFKAHQLVKKLVAKEKNTVLATMAAEILLDFVKSQRQINLRGSVPELPADPNSYDPEKISAALQAVGGLCGACEEAHDNACFVNQARRILIAAKTGIDLGLEYDGKKTLDHLMGEARRLADEKANSLGNPPVSSIPEGESENAVMALSTVENDSDDSGSREIDALREKDVFRSTLIDEVVAGIQKVADGNYSAEMPVHEDEQLGKLATAFNLMLKAMQSTMQHLDQLVQARSCELKEIMNTVPVGLLSLNSEFRINPEYSLAAEKILGMSDLRGRDFLDVLGLTQRRGEERKALRDYLELLQMGIVSLDMERLNPFSELQLPKGGWIRLGYHPFASGSGPTGLLVQLEDISETKKLMAQVEATQRESAQIKAIAEAPDVFRDFLDDVRKILDQTTHALRGLDVAQNSRERVDEMFRGIHTIKGVAGGFGMLEVGRCAGVLESALGRAREQERPDAALIADIQNELNRLEDAVAEAKKTAIRILGDDAMTTGPVLRIPITTIRDLELQVQTMGLPEAIQSELGRHLSGLRQIPARKGLERTTRLVPGLISRLQKNVRFHLDGEDTPIPYELAQELNGPLTHLLRNAFDHGVEGREERVASGKPEQGAVTVTVARKESWLEVSIRDDGKGLDPEGLRASAIRKGFLSPESAMKLSPAECLQLIFLPGFSTTDTVHEVSGRGVGMDVVQTTIARLGGSIAIDSVPGKSCRFSLRLPCAPDSPKAPE